MANDKLTWTELRKAVAEYANTSEQEAGQFLNALLEGVVEGLKTDKQVKIKGLGSFSLKAVAPRKSVNIATGETFTIAEAEKEAQAKYQKLLKMQQEPLAILGAVGANFRKIAAGRTLLDHGKNASDLQKLCGIPDYPARKTMEAARRVRPEFCAKASQLILETDYKMKTSFDEPERLLEQLKDHGGEVAAHANE